MSWPLPLFLSNTVIIMTHRMPCTGRTTSSLYTDVLWACGLSYGRVRGVDAVSFLTALIAYIPAFDCRLCKEDSCADPRGDDTPNDGLRMMPGVVKVW